MSLRPRRFSPRLWLGATALGAALAGTPVAAAPGNAFVQAVAAAAAADSALADFYRLNGYQALWTDADDGARLAALAAALATADDHGLPSARYSLPDLRAAAAAARTEGDRGRLEVALSAAYLAFARDVSSGALEPASIDPGILREIARPDPAVLLQKIATSGDPSAFLRSLPPKAPEYARLMKEKIRLESLGEAAALAPIRADRLEPGSRGAEVVALRDRLIALGYMGRSATAVYDRPLRAAVQRFQLEQGLTGDGVAGASTIAMLNAAPAAHLKAVSVAMERLRWMGDAPRGPRHIWVNQPDFTARVVDDGRVTFKTRVVIGRNQSDRRSPEFSDQMEFMVVNPSWGVPRSIIVKEYLPLLQKNPNAVSHLQVVDGSGRVISRGAVNFAAYSARSFPFGLRQPPSARNALGQVKFMFPNPYNIYLHDTPDKALFAKEERAFSHGCIRVGDPVDLAYTLLARQSDDPKALFAENLDTGKESRLRLDQPVPVHLVYFTAWPNAQNDITYRQDVYGRDQLLFDALIAAGVVLPADQG